MEIFQESKNTIAIKYNNEKIKRKKNVINTHRVTKLYY